jgi:hypothetical protein
MDQQFTRLDHHVDRRTVQHERHHGFLAHRFSPCRRLERLSICRARERGL